MPDVNDDLWPNREDEDELVFIQRENKDLKRLLAAKDNDVWWEVVDRWKKIAEDKEKIIKTLEDAIDNLFRVEWDEMECPCCKDWYVPCNNSKHTNEEQMCAFCATGQHDLAAPCSPS